MTVDLDAVSTCPECGAGVVTNQRGLRRFVCGREDMYLGNDRRGRSVVSVLKPCRTRELAAKLLKAEKHKLN